MSDRARLRRFGLTVGAGFAVLGGVFLWRGARVGPALLGLALMLALLGLIAPRLLGPVERAWMRVARAIGAVMTYVILTVTYAIVITPIGLLMRVLGRRPLGLRFDRQAATYWVKVDPDGPGSRPHHPY